MAKKRILDEPTDNKKCLSKEQMLQMDLYHERDKICKLEENLIQANISSLVFKKKMLQAQMEVVDKEISIFEAKLLKLKDLINDKKNLHREFIKQIKDALSIETETWGYDPETGEITTEGKE